MLNLSASCQRDDKCIAVGIEPDATSVLAIFGAMSLKLAVEKAGALDPASIASGLVRHLCDSNRHLGRIFF